MEEGTNRPVRETCYGKAPGRAENTYYEVLGEDDKALSGLAKRKEVMVIFSTENGIHEMTILDVFAQKCR